MHFTLTKTSVYAGLINTFFFLFLQQTEIVHLDVGSSFVEYYNAISSVSINKFFFLNLSYTVIGDKKKERNLYN